MYIWELDRLTLYDYINNLEGDYTQVTYDKKKYHEEIMQLCKWLDDDSYKYNLESKHWVDKDNHWQEDGLLTIYKKQQLTKGKFTMKTAKQALEESNSNNHLIAEKKALELEKSMQTIERHINRSIEKGLDSCEAILSEEEIDYLVLHDYIVNQKQDPTRFGALCSIYWGK